jgi:hypothetical protein
MPVRLWRDRQGRGRLEDAWPQGHVWTTRIAMADPFQQQPSEMMFRERHEKVQALSPERAQQSLAEGVRLGTLW